MESLRNVIKVASVEAGNGDTAISSHVDGVFLAELINLLGGETSVGEHTNLVDNVVPVVLIAQVLHVLVETVSHLVHAA